MALSPIFLGLLFEKLKIPFQKMDDNSLFQTKLGVILIIWIVTIFITSFF